MKIKWESKEERKKIIDEYTIKCMVLAENVIDLVIKNQELWGEQKKGNTF